MEPSPTGVEPVTFGFGDLNGGLVSPYGKTINNC
jgi:hypothetical protein